MTIQENAIGELPELGAVPAGYKELSEYMKEAKPNPLSAEIIDAISKEIDNSIKELMRMSGESYFIVVEKVSKSQMKIADIVGYYTEHGDYPL